MIINQVAVLGAGVMGSAIAAHLANAGIKVDLFDMVPNQAENRNALSLAAIDRLLKVKPPAFMHTGNARLITPCNLEDHFQQIREADWVIEAIVENLEAKRALYSRLESVCAPDTLISSNTSTLPLHLLCGSISPEFQNRFLITHFFNPPRYMRLLELVVSPSFRKDLLIGFQSFADIKLGKGCVLCHDTPGFIANRIGTYWIQLAFTEAIKRNLKIEQCDAGMSLFGIPKTGIFGLMDLVGLDLMPHILLGFKKMLGANDRLKAIAEVPPLLIAMIEQGYTGRKGKGGFYRLNPATREKTKESINLQTGDYAKSERYKIDADRHNQEAMRAFLSKDDPLGRYCWHILSETICYSAELIPEIADTITDIDTAMKLGYNWQQGPFEMADSLGIDWFVQQLESEQRSVPSLLQDGLPFYRHEQAQLHFKDQHHRYRPLARAPGIISLDDFKYRKTALLSNASASLWDINDGIVCLEFHSKMNTLDPDIMHLIRSSIELIQKKFQGMVIYNGAENFSAGANLKLLGPALMRQYWQAVTDIVRLGQETYQALKYAHFPVVGAPSGLALGGGCEILLHCDAVQAHVETYMGLVETGIGLVPGWGGCKEMLARCLKAAHRAGGSMPAIAKAFETVAMAKVSQSAREALDLLYLTEPASVTMNKSRLLADAKALTLSLIEGYQPPVPFEYHLPGPSGKTALEMAADNLYKAGKITAYDQYIAGILANILTGGETDITDSLSEQHILDLEREAFLTLIQQPQTLKRMEHMLTTGKPLRN